MAEQPDFALRGGARRVRVTAAIYDRGMGSAGILRWLFAAVVLGGLPGCALVTGNCGDCGSCPPAVRVVVLDASTGEPVEDVTVSGGGRCADDVYCVGESAGVLTFTVSAPGYEPREVTLVVPESRGGRCCDCGYMVVDHEVELVAS